MKNPKLSTLTFNYTNEEMISLIAQYQETKDDAVFAVIYEEVKPMVKKIALSFYGIVRYDYDYIPFDEYLNMAEIAIFRAVMQYDTSKRSPFNSFLKQNIHWTIKDFIIKPANNNNSQLNTFATKDSLDKPVETGRDALLLGDIVSHYHATDIDAVYTEAFVQTEEEAESDLLGQLQTLITNFDSAATVEDSNIMKVLLTTIVTEERATAKIVNKALAVAMPEVKPATMRKRKSRAIERFTEFAKSNGFKGLDLSQF